MKRFQEQRWASSIIMTTRIIILLIILLNFSLTTFGQVDSILFNSIVNNPKTKLTTRSKSNVVIQEFHELTTPLNRWSAFREFHPNRKIKEIGIFLNGYSYKVWTKYDSLGNILELIDYSNPKISQTHENFFIRYKLKADSLLQKHFDHRVYESIQLNLERSYWYAKNESGKWNENSNEVPHGLLLRYSIVINDSNIITPIVVNFKGLNDSLIIKKSGIPSSKNYHFNITYSEANKIASQKGYGIQHGTVFQKSEVLRLSFRDGEYFWTISSILKVDWYKYNGSNSKRGTATGKTILINCRTGETNETDYQGIVNYCD